VRGEYEENTIRKNFTPSEAVAIWRALTPMAKPETKERMLAGKKLPCGKFPQGQKGQAREKVAALIGKSYGSLSHAAKVVAAAEAEPKKYGHLVEEMDRHEPAHAPRLCKINSTQRSDNAPDRRRRAAQ
jgi:hypothetical protein